jgi:hypothetical protein
MLAKFLFLLRLSSSSSSLFDSLIEGLEAPVSGSSYMWVNFGVVVLALIAVLLLSFAAKSLVSSDGLIGLKGVQ